MKKMLFVLTLLFVGTILVTAQNTKRDEMLINRKEFSDRTLFQRFENNMVPTANERQIKREKNQARRELLLNIIDTSQIKLEFKKKLKQDVMYDPFSNRLKKFVKKYSLMEMLRD